MEDGMSFSGYINNPSGSSTVVTNRQMYKNMYKDKFDKLLLREGGSIKYYIYHDKASHDDSYYIHFKIPSEVIDNFYYDVVVQMYTNDKAKKNEANLRRYPIRFYSNDPAFVYTFAHAFSKNNLFIKDLAGKMSTRALKNKASMRNPKDEIWYVKSLYFAYLTMEKYGLFSRIRLSLNSKPYTRTSFKDIMKADDKIALRQSAEEKLKKEKKREEKKSKPTPVIQSNPTKKSNITKVSTVSNRTKVSKTVKQSKSVKRK